MGIMHRFLLIWLIRTRFIGKVWGAYPLQKKHGCVTNTDFFIYYAWTGIYTNTPGTANIPWHHIVRITYIVCTDVPFLFKECVICTNPNQNSKYTCSWHMLILIVRYVQYGLCCCIFPIFNVCKTQILKPYKKYNIILSTCKYYIGSEHV